MEDFYSIIKAFVDPVFIIFLLLIVSLIIFWKNSKNKTGALVLLLTIVLFYAVSIFPVANYLCHYLEKGYINKSVTVDKDMDAIVVLGGGSYDINYINKTFPSLFTTVRLAYAVDYYHKKPVEYFVCSGKGLGKVPEAEMMADLAVSLGVPKASIKIETQAINTWQSAANANKMFGNKDIHIGLVTSAYHMRRSEREFKKYFNNVFPLPADYLYSSPMGNHVIRYIPQSGSVYKTQLAVKEVAATIWYLIRGIF
ncbi:MAG: YdcF family protein [Syntrophaceae bacterium]|nr:YdcF family protein [Syntrophaceae bacterium]